LLGFSLVDFKPFPKFSNFGKGQLGVLLQKEPIVLFLPEDILGAIGVVINMVGLAWFHF
jgi:hypothetical protein